jgi:putative ABC transport system ATP-binding protein
VAVTESTPAAHDVSAEQPPAAESLVGARDLFKIYRDGEIETVALRGTSFDLAEGDFASLVGPSGSGKSTLLWIMAGLSLPSAGRMLVAGRDLARLDESQRAEIRSQSIGVVFQRGNLIPFLTARENVVLAMGMRGRCPGMSRRARALLGELGLAARVDHLPRQLSGGEAQRVGIALALANDPRLLLGDEVTGELDSATAEQVMELLLRIQGERNLTMFLVTHNPLVAGAARRHLTIVDGLVRET